MAKTRKTWVYSPPKPSAPQVPKRVKLECRRKPINSSRRCSNPSISNYHTQTTISNYIVDLFSKWYRHYFYFCAKYCLPGPNAIAPLFETKFARMEYVGANSFHLSFMRYTEEWVLLQPKLSLEECLSIIQSDPLFAP